ncbi:hypothetical protein CAP35_06330 [Chitinophagaceae bacterium IBVUCB1]|nr:hypothetical protein CAP35_06330 [Chitinophagaceae bacterium IBVUCB1]
MELNRFIGGILISCMVLSTSSCEKVDQPLSLPEKSGSEYMVIQMGEDYKDQLFFDLETKSVVYTSPTSSWDLAFETGVSDYHIFMNGGGTGVFVYNTHQTDMTKVLDAPKIKDNEWQFDQACGTNDSTGIGEWQSGGLSKSEVYIVKLDPTFYPDTFRKMQIVKVSAEGYLLHYAGLRDVANKTIFIPKNNNYNYTYFSFSENGRIVNAEPPKNTWDIVFTRYRIVYHYLHNYTYPVTGVLTNPYNTIAAKDSLKSYEAIDAQRLLKLKFTNHRDVIGYNWKQFTLDPQQGTSQYTVNKNMIYIVKNRRGYYYKLRFLDFYHQGVKGYPTFEYERIN